MTRAREPLGVRLSGIVKRYPRVTANDGADLSVAPRSLHALVGENGAGKSTLMRILYGMVQPDAGTIELNGRAVRFAGPRDAIAAGIGMVHQHFMLVPALSVAENVALGAEPRAPGAAGALGAWNLDKARAGVARLSREHGLAVDPDARVETLSVGEQQRVEILKVLYRGARLLILDEPTAVLTPQEADSLFSVLRGLREKGATVIFISHKLREVMALCDEATVLRRGRAVGVRRVAETTAEDLASLMIGGRVAPEAAGAPREAEEGRVVLSLDKACARGPRGETALRDVSLAARAGEIVGVAGVEGNGQRELAEIIVGLRPLESGALKTEGRVAFVPEDRRKQGLLLSAPAWENALLGRQRERKFGRPWALDRGAARRMAAALLRACDVRPPEPDQPAGAFSGGNQQKLIVGRELAKSPALLVAAHPTRGVDPGAARVIREKLRAARDAGAAILLISSDLDEILALCDRVAVLCGGRLVGECPRAEATLDRLGRWMGGVEAA